MDVEKFKVTFINKVNYWIYLELTLLIAIDCFIKVANSNIENFHKNNKSELLQYNKRKTSFVICIEQSLIFAFHIFSHIFNFCIAFLVCLYQTHDSSYDLLLFKRPSSVVISIYNSNCLFNKIYF